MKLTLSRLVIASLLSVFSARSELLQLDLSIFGMD